MDRYMFVGDANHYSLRRPALGRKRCSSLSGRKSIKLDFLQITASVMLRFLIVSTVPCRRTKPTSPSDRVASLINEESNRVSVPERRGHSKTSKEKELFVVGHSEIILIPKCAYVQKCLSHHSKLLSPSLHSRKQP